MRDPDLFKKRLLYVVIFLILFLLQSSPLKPIKLIGVTPELLLSGVILLAMFEGEKDAAVAGLILGFLSDIGGRLIGFNALLFMIVGYLIGILMNVLIRRNIISVVFLISAIVFIHNTLTYIFFFALWGDNNAYFAFTKIIIPKTIISTGFGLLLYALFKFLKTSTFLGKRREEV